MQGDNESANSGKTRVVLYCVKRSMRKSVAVPLQVWKTHCETLINVLVSTKYQARSQKFW